MLGFPSLFPPWGWSQIHAGAPGLGMLLAPPCALCAPRVPPWGQAGIPAWNSGQIQPGREGAAPRGAPSHRSLIPESSSELGPIVWREGKSRGGAEQVQLSQEQLRDERERFGYSKGFPAPEKNQLQEKVEKVPLILFLPPTSLEHFSHPEDDFRL